MQAYDIVVGSSAIIRCIKVQDSSDNIRYVRLCYGCNTRFKGRNCSFCGDFVCFLNISVFLQFHTEEPLLKRLVFEFFENSNYKCIFRPSVLCPFEAPWGPPKTKYSKF